MVEINAFKFNGLGGVRSSPGKYVIEWDAEEESKSGQIWVYIAY